MSRTAKKKHGKTKQRHTVGRLPKRGHCTCGKRIYLKPEADHVATVLSRNTSEKLVPYRCTDGQGWHVGHDD